MQRWVFVLSFLALATVGVLAPSPLVAQQEPDPIYNVNPPSGSAGTRFAFMATGFLGYEQVGVWLNDPQRQPHPANVQNLDPATGFGRVDWYWTAPAGIQPGDWQMIARGVQSGVERIIPVQITESTTPGPPEEIPGVTSNVNPQAGNPGTRFAFMATGFQPGEQVGAWVNTPDGQPLPIVAEQLNPANADGRADWYWTAPSYVRPGRWQMLVRGVSSGLERVIYFEIR